MKKSINKKLKIILPLVLGGFLVWYSLSKISIQTLFEYFKEANYLWIFFGLAAGVLSHFSRAYRWSYLLEPLGYKPKLANNIMAVLVGYLVNYAVPRAGEVSRAVVLTNYEDVPFEKGFGTIVAERVADLIMFFIIIIIAFFIQFDFIFDQLTKNFDPNKILLLTALFFLAVVIFIFYVKKATKGIALKLKNFVLGVVEGATSIFKMKYKWAFIAHTVFIWFMYVVMFWVIVPAIKNFDVPFGAILIGFIAGAFSIAATNGGIGIYPIAVAGAFTLFGIDKEPATAFGWIMWTTQTVMIIIFGGLAFIFLPIYNRNKKNNNAISN